MLPLRAGPELSYLLPSNTTVTEGDVWSETRVKAESELPPRTATLYGPDGVCQAVRSDEAVIDVFGGGPSAAAITYRLTGCAGANWAPLVALGNATEMDRLHWAPSQVEVLRGVAKVTAAKDDSRFRPWLAKLDAKPRDGKAAEPRIELELVTTTEPDVVIASYGAVWQQDPSCHSEFIQNTQLALVTEDRVTPMPSPDAGEDPWRKYHLLGVLHERSLPKAAVLMDAIYQLHIAPTPFAGDVLSALSGQQWTTGAYNEEFRFDRRFVEECEGE